MLIQELPANSRNVIIDEKANVKLLLLTQKKDEDLYTYNCRTESLLKKIYGQNQVLTTIEI